MARSQQTPTINPQVAISPPQRLFIATARPTMVSRAEMTAAHPSEKFRESWRPGAVPVKVRSHLATAVR